MRQLSPLAKLYAEGCLCFHVLKYLRTMSQSILRYLHVSSQHAVHFSIKSTSTYIGAKQCGLACACAHRMSFLSPPWLAMHNLHEKKFVCHWRKHAKACSWCPKSFCISHFLENPLAKFFSAVVRCRLSTAASLLVKRCVRSSVACASRLLFL